MTYRKPSKFCSVLEASIQLILTNWIIFVLNRNSLIYISKILDPLLHSRPCTDNRMTELVYLSHIVPFRSSFQLTMSTSPSPTDQIWSSFIRFYGGHTTSCWPQIDAPGRWRGSDNPLIFRALTGRLTVKNFLFVHISLDVPICLQSSFCSILHTKPSFSLCMPLRL